MTDGQKDYEYEHNYGAKDFFDDSKSNLLYSIFR